MLLGFKTELKPNNKQRTLFLKHCGIARHAWNSTLDYTYRILEVNRLAKEAGRDDLKIKFPSAIDLNKWHRVNIKAENPWYYECSKAAHQNSIRNLRVAWDRAFKKISKPPNFKKRGQHDSFTLDGSILCESNQIKLPRIGWVKTFEGLPSGFKPKNATVSRDGTRWLVSFKLEIEPKQAEKTNQSIGVDLGIKTFATLSTGEQVKAPIAQYKRLKAKISKLQYLSRNKQKGSNRWRKAQSSIQRLHYRIKCLRRDFIHKFTTKLCKENAVICIEDLNVSGMVKNHKLAEVISMQAWSETRRQLEYKSELYSSEVRVIGRFEPSSKVHYKCGWKDDLLKLSDRVFHCPVCNESIDRDLNASLNIERIGLGLSPSRNAETEVPTPVDEVFNKQLNLAFV